MKRFFSFISKHSRTVLIITAVLLCICTYSATQTSINSDMAVYLDDESTGNKTMNFLAENFDVHGDAAICIQGELNDFNKLERLVSELGEEPGIAKINWLGSYSRLFTVSEGRLQPENGMIDNERLHALTENSYKTAGGKGYYILSLALAEGNASESSSIAMDNAGTILANYSEENGGADYYIGGTAMQGKNMLDSALGELPWFLLVAVLIISMILLLTSKSLIAALISLLTIGISIGLNMGSNFFTNSVSLVTFSVSAILQLALTMDYSIFLTHAFDREEKAGNPKALTTAIKKTFAVILASALTTIAGFCALFFMNYKLGADLGAYLAKGIALSFITVLIVQPCLMTVLKKAAKKTRHRALDPSFEKYSRVPSRLRYFILILTIVLLLPSAYFSTQLEYYYIDTYQSEESEGAKGVLDDSGSQTALVVPFESNEAQYGFMASLREMEENGELSNITSYYSLTEAIIGEFSVPIYASEDDTSSVLATAKLSTFDILQILQNGEKAGDNAELSTAVKEAIEKAAPALIEQLAADSSRLYGRSLTEAEMSLIKLQAALQLQEQFASQLSSRFSEFSEQSAQYSDSLEEMKSSFFSTVGGSEYTLYNVSIAAPSESDEAVETLENIETLIYDTFNGKDSYLAAGNTQIVRDLAAVTNRDFVVVSAVSALFVLLVLIFTFKSVLLPLLMLALIELAILINMSISAISGNSINFMTYVVISAIQMGATIDYAILVVKNYRSALPDSDTTADAVAAAIKNSAFSIITSMSILAGACLPVFFISSDKIIKEISLMVARGAFISALLVLLILPGMISLKKKKPALEK